MAEGTRLPSVRTLAAQHHIGVTTALQALRWLRHGEIEARPRSGYFVAKRPASKRGSGGGGGAGAVGAKALGIPGRGGQALASADA